MGRQTKIAEYLGGAGNSKQKQKRKHFATTDSSSSESDTAQVKLTQRAPKSITPIIKIEDDEESDELKFIKPPTRKRARATQVLASRSASSRNSDQDHISEESDKQQRVISHALRKRKLSSTQVIEDSDDEESPTKRRRILKKGLRPEFDEEQDLTKELDKEVILESRFRNHGKKSAFTRNLEKRKRQRMGQRQAASESDEDSDESEIIPIPGARAGDASSESDEDNSEENFIVEDDDDNLVALPMEFSADRAQSLSVHFKIVLQLMVHIACMPPHLRKAGMKRRLEADDGDAQYFKNSLAMLRRKLESVRDSQVTSSIWTNEYKNHLDTYPKLVVSALVEPSLSCLACRKRNAISTRECRLSGEPYNEVGYEPLNPSSDSSDSGSDSNDDTSSSESQHSDDEENDEGPKAWHVGQHCARRTKLHHSLTHWEWSLFQNIEHEVDKYTKLKNKKRRKFGLEESKTVISDPDKIVEWLEKKEIVKEQWHVIQGMIDDAQNIEQRRPGEVD